jgi:hypothetical protein
MAARRVFLVGDSLFAASLAQLLEQSPRVQVAGTYPTLEALLPQLPPAGQCAILFAGISSPPDAALLKLLSAFPEIPVLCSDPDANMVQVLSSQPIPVHSAQDLLAALSALPEPE